MIKVKILLVDDEPDNLFLTENLLRKENREFFCAQSGHKALEILLEHEFSLVILDVQMPGMDGFETATLIRQSKTGEHLPIIFVTAYHMAEHYIFQGYESGAVDYLFKPIQANILKQKVDVFVELYQNKQRYVAKSRALEQALENQHKTSETLRKRTKELHETQTQLQKANASLSLSNRQMLLDLEQAQKTQLALLPKKFPNASGIEMAAKYQPMQQIGGDFYDVFDLANGRIGILLGDVTGHDTSAALISFMIAGLFKTFAYEGSSILSIIEQVNHALYNNIPGYRFATAFYGIYKPKTHILEYVSCGHPEGYVVQNQGKKITYLSRGGPPLGVFPKKKGDFQSETLQLASGDRIFLYTDGILEMKDSNGRMFGKNSLKTFLKSHHALPIQELLNKIYSHVLTFSDTGEYDDDVALLGLDVK